MNSPGVLAGLNLLVAEDDSDAREIFSSVLAYYGARVTLAEGIDDGRRLLLEVAPDVVISDMRLASGDGATFLKAARKDRSDAPFIAVSAYDFDSEELERAGFAAYLPKPIDHNKLVDTILAVAPMR